MRDNEGDNGKSSVIGGAGEAGASEGWGRRKRVASTKKTARMGTGRERGRARRGGGCWGSRGGRQRRGWRRLGGGGRVKEGALMSAESGRNDGCKHEGAVTESRKKRRPKGLKDGAKGGGRGEEGGVGVME